MPLFRKNFTLLVTGQFISLLGNSIQRFAFSLFILKLTGSAAIFSVLLSLCILPQIILAPFGGAFADRLSKKKLMVAFDFLAAAVLIIFSILSAYLSMKIILVGVIMCLLAIIQSIYEPCVRSCIPLVVEEQNYTAANSVVSGISAFTNLLGPVAAGFLFGAFGLKLIFLLNIASFLLSGILECFLTLPSAEPLTEKPSVLFFLKDIRESFSFLFYKKRLIFYMLLISASLNLFLTPIYTVGIPYIEKILFGVSDRLYGISEGIIALGMIAGAISVNIISKKIPLTRLHLHFCLIVMLILCMGATTLPFSGQSRGGVFTAYLLFTAIGFLFAISIANINILFMTFLQMETPAEMMGKIMALVTSLCVAAMPVGQILYGLLYDYFAHTTIVIYVFSATISVFITFLIYKIIHRGIFAQSEALS